MSTVYKVKALQDTSQLTEGNIYEVVQDTDDELMWMVLGDNSSTNIWYKSRFSDPIIEQPTKKQYVQAIETICGIVAGNYYEVLEERTQQQIWMIKDEAGEIAAYFKERFKAPVNELPKQKLENVFIRVNGNDEKEAAIELLKSLGYDDYSDYGYSTATIFLACHDGSFGGLEDFPEYIPEFYKHKELKVDKQIIPAKTIFTLTKEKTYNVDGKELTRVEVEGIIQGLDIKMNCLRNIIGE